MLLKNLVKLTRKNDRQDKEYFLLEHTYRAEKIPSFSW